MGYNCNECRRRNRVGTKNRDCIGQGNLQSKYPHSISREEFYAELTKKIEEHETTDLEILCRRIGKGVCIKSFPTTRLSAYLIDLVQFCKEFHMLYCNGAVEEQPNLFFEAYRVIGSEISRLEQQVQIKSEKE